jgi:hypothetical protein
MTENEGVFHLIFRRGCRAIRKEVEGGYLKGC